MPKSASGDDKAPVSVQPRPLVDVVESSRISMPVSFGQFCELAIHINAHTAFLFSGRLTSSLSANCSTCARQIASYASTSTIVCSILWNCTQASIAPSIWIIRRLVYCETLLDNGFALGSIVTNLTTAARKLVAVTFLKSPCTRPPYSTRSILICARSLVLSCRLSTISTRASRITTPRWTKLEKEAHCGRLESSQYMLQAYPSRPELRHSPSAIFFSL